MPTTQMALDITKIFNCLLIGRELNQAFFKQQLRLGVLFFLEANFGFGEIGLRAHLDRQKKQGRD